MAWVKIRHSQPPSLTPLQNTQMQVQGRCKCLYYIPNIMGAGALINHITSRCISSILKLLFRHSFTRKVISTYVDLKSMYRELIIYARRLQDYPRRQRITATGAGLLFCRSATLSVCIYSCLQQLFDLVVCIGSGALSLCFVAFGEKKSPLHTP